jgi:putative serine protease PepD
MARDGSGAAASGRGRPGRRQLLLAGAAILAAAIVGGVIGGLIVRATWSPGDGSAGGSACKAATVADNALPSVVTVQVRSGEQGGSGSGVVIRPDGYILTNNHVVTVGPAPSTISVVRSDGETTPARLVATDPLTDLAVIKAEDASNLPPISLGDSGSLQVGDPVVALGSPLGLASTVTSGIVSALNRYVRVPSPNAAAAHLVGAIQTDASINPGNSGGALVDCAARLVGINTAGAAVPNSNGGSIGLGFAIPADLANGIADELIANGRITRPNFGFQVQEIPQRGLYVVAVQAGGPAEAAGLRPGDVITEIDGDAAHSVDPLIVKTLTMKAGDVLHLAFVRHGAEHTTELTLS